MLKIKNQTEKTAELYISGNIVDDDEGGWIKRWGNTDGDTTGYEFPQKLKEELEEVEDKELTIYINSYGGSVFAGVALANMVARRKNKTICIVDGICASIATQIFFMGDECKIPANCYLMIHKPECYDMGNADNFRKTADTLDTIQRGLETTYQRKVKDGITAEKITELVNTSSYFTGAECAEYFKVEVLDALKVVNCVGSAEKLKKFGLKNIPNNLHFLNERPQPLRGGSGVPVSIAEQELKIKIALARAKGALI